MNKIRYKPLGTKQFCFVLIATLWVTGNVWGEPGAGQNAKDAVASRPGKKSSVTRETSAAATSNVTKASVQPNASFTPYGQDPSLFVLTLAEEFDKGWNPRLWNDHIWYEQSSPTKNFEVSDGTLKIWPAMDASGKFFPRILDTDGKFAQAYGYFEMEAKLPVGKGVWPAFWLYNHLHENSFFPEIDIMEAYSGGGAASGWSDSKFHPTAIDVTVSPMGASGPNKGPSSNKIINQLGDLSKTFHKYALKWETKKLTFYFDGKETYSVNATMSDPLYILLDIQFGSASGTPDGTTPDGKQNSFEINYIRVWKFR